MITTFYDWLGRQVERKDDVGAFARFAIKDRVFPRVDKRLHFYISRYEGMPIQRAGVLRAHREWRLAKRGRGTIRIGSSE